MGRRRADARAAYPLASPEEDDEALTLATASDLLRSWDWPVPDEMLIFGGNGQGDSFGLWAICAIMQWANPRLPDPKPDPYARGLTGAQADEIARSDVR
jgi:hypothetical protein